MSRSGQDRGRMPQAGLAARVRDRAGSVDPSAARHAEAVFVGATRYTGPLAWLRLAPQWVRMVRQMRRMPGYLYHRVYYEPPFSLGTLGFFQTQDDLMRFARTGEHRELMGWVLGERNASGGYIRIYQADPIVGLPDTERATTEEGHG